jgi:hypothetical protein
MIKKSQPKNAYYFKFYIHSKLKYSIRDIINAWITPFTYNGLYF